MLFNNSIHERIVYHNDQYFGTVTSYKIRCHSIKKRRARRQRTDWLDYVTAAEVERQSEPKLTSISVGFR